MNKVSKDILLVVVVFILTVGLSGCTSTEHHKENYKELFLGKWVAGDTPEGEDGSVVFNFFSNDSFYVNLTNVDQHGNSSTQTAWMTYNITNNTLIMVIEGNEVHLGFSFSNNDKTLTLTEEDGTSTVIKRQ